MSPARYDAIGEGYARTRREDPRLRERIHAARPCDAVELLLIPGSHDDYGDIGLQFAGLRGFLDRAFADQAISRD